MSVWGQLHFPDFNRRMAARLFYYHDLALVVIVVISVLVLMFLTSFVFSNVFIGESMHLKLKKCSWLELGWSIAPFFVLFTLGFVSMKNLYDIEVGEKVKFAVKVTGHQWYWEYSYVSNFSNVGNKGEFNSFVMSFLLNDSAGSGFTFKEVFYSVFDNLFSTNSNNNNIVVWQGDVASGYVSGEQVGNSGFTNIKDDYDYRASNQFTQEIVERSIREKAKVSKDVVVYGSTSQSGSHRVVDRGVGDGTGVVSGYTGSETGEGVGDQSIKDYIVPWSRGELEGGVNSAFRDWDVAMGFVDGGLVVDENYSGVLKGVSVLFLEGDWYFKYDSYIVPEDVLLEGDFFGLKRGFRNQDVRVPCYLVRSEKNEVLISTADVMHRWGVTELGVKADAVPGRQNAVKVVPLRSGAAFGFCYELCGAGHSQMPICVFIANKLDVEWIIKRGVLETDAALDYLSRFA